MGARGPIRQGQVYWLDHCSPLAGDVAKRRPVVVLSSSEMLSNTAVPVAVVAVSTSVRSDDETAIALPNRQDTPWAKTGLPKRSWVVPKWYLVVERSRLTELAGYVSGDLLGRIILAVERAQAEEAP